MKVLIIEDKVGRRIFPSVVAYKDSGGESAKSQYARDISPLLFSDASNPVIFLNALCATICLSFIFLEVEAVAYDALPYLSLRPESTIFNAKRFIGGSLNDSATQSYAAAHPYNVVTTNISKHSKVGFELSGYSSSSTDISKVITPENVGSEVSLFSHYLVY